MILIEQVFDLDNARYDYVRCPACGRGRLCDKHVGEKALAIAIHGGTSSKGNRIILKCPKCSQKFLISFPKE